MRIAGRKRLFSQACAIVAGLRSNHPSIHVAPYADTLVIIIFAFTTKLSIFHSALS